MEGILLFDADGDGDNDLFMNASSFQHPDRSYIGGGSFILFNDGSGDFSNAPRVDLPLPPLSEIPLPRAISAHSLDLNRDGLNDLVVVMFDNRLQPPGGATPTIGQGYVQVFINQGAGQFTEESAERVPSFTGLF
jgi:hypothetical protein